MSQSRETPDINTKEWIDNASYEALLTRYRYSPIVGDPLFYNEELHEYFIIGILDKGILLTLEERKAIDKRVGKPITIPRNMVDNKE